MATRVHVAPRVHVALLRVHVALLRVHVATRVHVALLRLVHVALLLRDDARDRRAEIAPRSPPKGVYDLVNVALDHGEPRRSWQSKGRSGRDRIAQVRGKCFGL